MGDAYPELRRAEALITQNFLGEEERFRRTLSRGMDLLDDAMANLPAGGKLDGELAFRLYDTFGFPVDLTADVLRGRGFLLDMEGFDAAMARQKAEARKNWSGSGQQATDKLWFELKETHGATEFLGYTQTTASGKLQAIVLDGAAANTAKTGQKIALIFNQTPFYGESGGQKGDVGTIQFDHGAVVEVTDTQKPLADLIVHIGLVKEGQITLGDTASLKVDVAYRNKLRANHSATHILHAVLRKQLGEHVTQQGSMVAADRLRFDISHPRAISRAELDAVEAEVNRIIWQNTATHTLLTTPEEAIKAGALALFGEKYGDEVRVIRMGLEEGEADYSVELCGGTHVERTGDIGLFVLVSDSALASGVRRLEGLTGQAALDYLKQQQQWLFDAASAAKIAPRDVPARLAQLSDETRQLQKDMAALKAKIALGGGAGVAANDDAVEQIGTLPLLAKVLDGLPAKELRGVVDGYKQKITSGVVVLASRDEGRASLVVGVTDDLTSRVSAVDLVRAGSAAAGGSGGGGRADFAQGGVPDANAVDKAMQAIRAKLQDQ
jgi:alanyl-tRNA synthetase